jgi:hypothetical protein
MPLTPETAVHGGFTLAVWHFISEMTDFSQHPQCPKPSAAQPADAGTDRHKLRLRYIVVIAKLVNLRNIQPVFSAKSLIRHEVKTIKGRRAFARLTFVLLDLTECLAKQDLRRIYWLNILATYCFAIT